MSTKSQTKSNTDTTNQSVDQAVSPNALQTAHNQLGNSELAGRINGNAEQPPSRNVRIEFAAFIPGSLGNSFSSYEQPTDLENQQEFDQQVNSISGTWLPEPGGGGLANGLGIHSMFDGTSSWFFGTDNRGFGGGNYRLHSVGSFDVANIGTDPGKTFQQEAGPSHRVRTNVDGFFSQTGAVEGPVERSASTSDSEDRHASTGVTTFELSNSAGYPFVFESPNIDYEATCVFQQTDAGPQLQVFGTHNMFPAYELRINGASHYTHMPQASGPGLWNLNTSTEFSPSPIQL